MYLKPAFYDICQPAVCVNLVSGEKKKEFKINKTYLEYRTYFVAAGCFALLLLLPSFPMAYVPALCSAGYYWFEKRRSQSFLNATAVDVFMKSDIVPAKVMNYLAVTLEATKQLCQQKDVKLEKIESKNGMDLLEKAINVHNNVFTSTSKKEELKDVIQQIEISGLLKKERLKELFTNSKLGPKNAILLLNHKQITPADFTSDRELSDFLCKIEDGEVLNSMLKHGFKLNLQENLMLASIKRQWDHVCVYLNAGTKLPSADQEIATFRRYNKIVQLTYGQFFESSPEIKKILDQLLQKDPLPTPKINTPTFAFWKPAVLIERGLGFHVGVRSIEVRTFIVALSAICVNVAIATSTLIAASTFIPLGMMLAAIPITYLYYKWEWSRATQLLNQKAVEQFKSSLPEKYVFEHIVKNNDVELIPQLEGDLTKLCEDGSELYDWVCKLRIKKDQRFKSHVAIFEKLANVIFTKVHTSDQKFSYLIKAIQSGKPEFVDYLLESGKVKAEEFSESQQFDCLIGSVDARTVEILKKYRFNIDAKKGELTPLLHIASLQSLPEDSKVQFTPTEHIEALLKAGANIKVTANNQDIYSLCKDDNLRKFLKYYTDKN